MQKDRTGADPQAGIQIVCREHNRCSAAYLATDDALEQSGAVWVEAGERLIEDEQVGAMQDGACDRKPLKHSARERPYRSVGDMCQFDLCQKGRGIGSLHTVQTREESQVLLTVQIPVEKTVMADDADAATEVSARGKRAAEHADTACLRSNEPGHRPKERRLAGAVRPEQHDGFAAAHVEIDAAQNPHGPEPPLESADLDCCSLLLHNARLRPVIPTTPARFEP